MVQLRSHTPHSPNPVPGTILVIEDRGDLRGAMLQLLELAGYQVNAAADGEEALLALNAAPGRFALVLLDLRLPGRLSGYELRVRQLANPELAREIGRAHV